MSPQKMSLVRKIEGRRRPDASAAGKVEDDPKAKQAPPETVARDAKRTVQTQGTLHRRHK